MKNIKFTILGVATLLFALTLNFRHALDDYGVLDNKLHVEVLAQSNTTDGGDTTDEGGSSSDCKEGTTTDGSIITVTVCDRKTDWKGIISEIICNAEAPGQTCKFSNVGI